MPPPLPPSKSYLIVINDSDLEDTDDDEDHQAGLFHDTSSLLYEIDAEEDVSTRKESPVRTLLVATPTVDPDVWPSREAKVTPANIPEPPQANSDLVFSSTTTSMPDEQPQPQGYTGTSFRRIAARTSSGSTDEDDDNDDEDLEEDAAHDTPSAHLTVVMEKLYTETSLTRHITPVVSPAAKEEEVRPKYFEDHDIDEEEIVPVGRSTSVETLKSKKRKKRKKKKKTSASAAATAQNDHQVMVVSKKPSRKVHFGHVLIREFNRSLGTGSVPGDGGWPLGLGDEITADLPNAMLLPVEEYEATKQQILLDRWNDIQRQAPSSSTATASPPVPIVPLETRQWDYKRKVKNPLFSMLSEKERMQILLASSGTIICESSSSPLHSNEGYKHTTRSSKIHEQYNETYTQFIVHQERHELEQIRNSRNPPGNLGCSCRKLNVYLLPPGGGGKKAHHRRMNVVKVKEELSKRNMLPERTCTREELELLLHEAVSKERCCSTEDDCECARNGIECQADACLCWLDSHQKPPSKSSKQQSAPQPEMLLSAMEIQNRCGNRHGMYVVDVDAIDAHRQQVLSTSWSDTACCPPWCQSID